MRGSREDPTSRDPEVRDDRPARVSIAAAKGVIERNVGRSGTERWSAFDFDSAKNREIACLCAWADESGAWLSSPHLAFWEGGPGMGEHNVKEHDGRFWKATKNGRFGIYFDASARAQGDPVRQIQKKLSATPYQYLARLELSNEWSRSLPGLCPADFDDLTRLEGLVYLDEKFVFLTSQPCFPHDADQPDGVELASWLRSQYFLPVTEGIFYRPSDGLGLFDVKPANIIRSGGVLVPVDVIPIRLSGRLKSVIHRVVGIIE